MCVTILLHNIVKNYPVILANNRDELISRKFINPIFLCENPKIFGPKDLERGGTWLGINEHRIIVNVLNRYTGKTNFFGSKNFVSRGELVLELLKFNSINKILEKIKSLKLTDFLPFHLITVSKEKAFLIIKEDSIKIFDISNKIFIIGNLDPFKKWEKYNFGYNFLKNCNFNNLKETIKNLKALLTFHKGDKSIPSTDYAVNLGDFQTTSSSIIYFNSKTIFKFFNGFPTKNSKYSRYELNFR